MKSQTVFICALLMWLTVANTSANEKISETQAELSVIRGMQLVSQGYQHKCDELGQSNICAILSMTMSNRFTSFCLARYNNANDCAHATFKEFNEWLLTLEKIE